MELLKCVIVKKTKILPVVAVIWQQNRDPPQNVAEYKWTVVFLDKLDDHDLKIVYYVNSILVIKLFSNLGDIMRHRFLLSAPGIFIHLDTYTYKTFSN